MRYGEKQWVFLLSYVERNRKQSYLVANALAVSYFGTHAERLAPKYVIHLRNPSLE
jgi:hypothetical protein